MEILRNHIKKTITLSDDELAVAESFFSEQHFRKREMIIKENTSVKHVYFIVSGLLRLYFTDTEAKEHIISFSMEDWWETDYSAFYTQTRATQSLQCLENTTVLKLSFDGYHQLLSSIPKMSNFFLSKAVSGHIASQRRILSLMNMSAAGRYEQFLEFYPSLVQRIPKTVLAAYLGVSRETMSRLFLESK